MPAAEHDRIVAALRDVPGVSEADVEPDDVGGPGRLRLGLDAGVDEAQVTARVDRLLREHFGLGVDPAEPAPGGPGPVVPTQRSRPSISRMNLLSAGLDVTATVTLASGQVHADGQAQGVSSQSGVTRAVANATLRAVEDLARGQVRLDLEHLEVRTVGPDTTVLVAITLVSAGGAERLTGAAAVREDLGHAVIRASLDALNRRLQALLD